MLVYTLLLEGGKRYVGRVRNEATLDSRVGQHLDGQGAEWTKMYPFVEVEDLIYNAAPTDEDARVISLMVEHGIENVRGGTFCTPVLDEVELKILNKMVDSARGSCYHCHQTGHCTGECPMSIAKSVQHGGDWICPDCGNNVFGKKNECRCGKWKPKEFKAVVYEAGWKPGDWKCPRCGDHQFAKRGQCGKCGTVKPMGGKQPRGDEQEKDGNSQPVKKPRLDDVRPDVSSKVGDWPCPSCNAHNFASRKECFKCRKMKPLSDAEKLGTCVVCMDKPVCFAIQPCGHICLCEDCSFTPMPTCPVCRAPATKTQRMFHS